MCEVEIKIHVLLSCAHFYLPSGYSRSNNTLVRQASSVEVVSCASSEDRSKIPVNKLQFALLIHIYELQ